MAAKPIVAGTDGSEESLRAVDWAAREAALRGAPLRIVAAAAAPPGMSVARGRGRVREGDRRPARASATARWPRRPSGPPRRHPAC